MQKPHGLLIVNPLVLLGVILTLDAADDLIDQGIKGLAFEANNIELISKFRHGANLETKVRVGGMGLKFLVENFLPVKRGQGSERTQKIECKYSKSTHLKIINISHESG